MENTLQREAKDVMEAMLKKKEAIEEGRVKKNWRKKGVLFGAPPGPRGLTGAQE